MSRREVSLFKALAEQGDPEAQFSLGVMHHSGEGVPQDYAQAMKWRRLVAASSPARRLSAGTMLGSKTFRE